TAIDEQSPDIADGVDKALEARQGKMSEERIDAIGAGDQGLMFGFACDESEELMPLPISLAHQMAKRLAEIRKDETLPDLRTDGKMIRLIIYIRMENHKLPLHMMMSVIQHVSTRSLFRHRTITVSHMSRLQTTWSIMLYIPYLPIICSMTKQNTSSTRQDGFS